MSPPKSPNTVAHGSQHADWIMTLDSLVKGESGRQKVVLLGCLVKERLSLQGNVPLIELK
jgi:hypothetical protein